MYFPTTCVDGFFDDPKMVRDLAHSLERTTAPEGKWPGTRTKPLHEVATGYNTFFNNKLFSLFYDFRRHQVNWEVESYFQFIDPYGEDKAINTGWVHRDGNCVLAGVVYLNENPEVTAGTSLYTKKTIESNTVNGEEKEQFFKDSSNIDEALYLKKLEENNSNFIETLTVGNVYNRLVCYDGANFHKANNFVCGNEPRLTQVFFVKNVMADWYPIPSMRAF
jgi:hypothetical protein